MKTFRLLSMLLVAAFLWTACQGPENGASTDPVPNSIPKPDSGTNPDSGTDPEDQQPAETIQVTFTESAQHLVNPERGFYGGAVDIFSASSPVSVNKAKALREQGITLMYIGFYLQSFMDGDISQAYLDMIQKSMDALRTAGIKCVLRFAYQNSQSKKPWDAPIHVVLRHVDQLKPLLEKNEDVIFVLQAGFVGVWGEWYYTEHFNMNPSSDEDFEPRRNLTAALLEVLPESRQIALRTPEFKMRMFHLSLADTLTAQTAHDGSSLSRLAGHNDCFGASKDDYGTFDNVDDDRAFWKADSRYFIMGGETCDVSNYCTCTASLKDMKDYHWTYLNSGYNSSVLDRWTQKGCMDEIKDRLGYRLVMKQATCTGVIAAGKSVNLVIDLENTGFAAPMNPRNAELVFVAEDGTATRFSLGSDPRSWQPGPHRIELGLTLPAAKGTLFLALEDPLLPDRPEYSIALANEGVFDTVSGWNKLMDIQHKPNN